MSGGFDKWNLHLKKWKNTYEFLGILAAITIAAVAVWQMQQTNEALAIQRSQIDLDERAWVTVDKVEALPGSTNIFLITIKNTGKTPAINTVLWRSIILTNKDAVFTCPLNPTNMPPKFIILGPDSTSTGDTSSMPVSNADWRHVYYTNPTDHLYLYGIIKYDDIFGRHHWTRFCFDVVGGLTDFQGTPFGNSCDDMQTTK